MHAVDVAGTETPRRCRGVLCSGVRRAPDAYSLVAAFLALGAAFAVAFGAGLAAAFGAAFFGATALGPVFVAVAGALSTGLACAAAFAAAASARAVLLSAARALPAAVCAPFALPALPAAMRAFAAFAAAALPVVLTTRPPVWTCSPPSAALTFSVRRDLRRAAAFGWIAPTFAARSRALSASASAATGSIVDSAGAAAAVRALAM